VFAGRYEVLAHLGDGAMGSVYRAHQLLLDREVAVKVLRSADVDGRARRRLHREARAVARIRHPHVVQVYDYGETECGDPYLVMELVDGPTVSQWARATPPTLNDALTAGAGMLAGLAAAHARGVLHRDLKPANMLLREGDPSELVLVDFGIAAVLWGEKGEDGEERLTREGTVLGTPLYMSPEQALGQEVGPESDVYAAGVVLYEWLSGRVPFTGPLMEVMRSHAFRPLPPLVPRDGMTVPLEVKAVVERALSKRRTDRFGSAAAMRDALLRSHKTSAGPSVPVASRAPVALPPTIATGQLLQELPFVGRVEEMARLEDVFAGVSAGRGGITFIHGVPGIGASRLASEALARFVERGVARGGRGASHGGGNALDSVRQAVEDLLGSRTLGLDTLRRRLTSALMWVPGPGLMEEEKDALVRWLRPESGDSSSFFENEVSWSSTLVERFLRLLARDKPVLLWLDDFEREGSSSGVWLAGLAASQRIESFPLWVIVTRSVSGTNSGESSVIASGELATSAAVTRLHLAPLPERSIIELAEAMAPLTRQAAGRVAEKAAGLPLVAVQLVRHLGESGRLVPVGQRLGLPDGDDLQAALPGGLRELWEHRLDSVARGTSQPKLAAFVLQVGAALGMQFDVEVAAGLLAVLGTTPQPDDFDGVLDELISAGVFVESGGASDELRWEHPSLADVELDRLGTSRRGRSRARELGLALLDLPFPRRVSLAARVVRLFELAGEVDELPAPALIAGRQALSAGRLGDASRLLRLAASSSAPSQIGRVAREALAESAALAGRYQEARDLYSGLLLDERLGVERGRLLVGRGRSRLGAQDLRGAAGDLRAGIDELRPHLPEVSAAREISRALATLRSVVDVLGDVTMPGWQTSELLDAATERADRHVIAANLGYLAIRDGDLLRAMELHRISLEAARAGHFRQGVLVALYDLGWAARRAGEPDAALTHLLECQALADSLGRHVMLARVHNELGELHRERHRTEEAHRHYQEGASLLGVSEGPEAFLCVLNLARLEADTGREERARTRLVELEAESRVPHELLGPFNLTLASCLAGHDDDAARERLRLGLGSLSSSTDARSGALDILEVLADRWETADEVAGAREARDAADALRSSSE